jgi:hypothetical protein
LVEVFKIVEVYKIVIVVVEIKIEDRDLVQEGQDLQVRDPHLRVIYVNDLVVQGVPVLAVVLEVHQDVGRGQHRDIMYLFPRLPSIFLKAVFMN